MESGNRKKVSKICLIISGIVAIVAAYFVFSTMVPYSVTDQYYCPYCRAYRDDTKVLGLKLAPKIKESIVTEYWRSQIDVNHKHSWRRFSRLLHMFGGPVHCCGYIDTDHYMLRREAEIAILSSFETPAERKSFAAKFFYWDEKKPQAESEKRGKAIEKLQAYYDQDPSRKDWQKILKRLKVI